MYRDKKQNNGIIDFTTVDRDGRIVKMTPRLFVETACVVAHTDKYGLSKIIAASSSQYRKKHLELLDEKRLPSIKEFFSFCRLLNTFKADFVRMFELIVNKQIPATSEPATAKSTLDVYRMLKGIDNSSKESEVNTLNLQFTWPKNWGINIKDVGEGICEVFKGEDFKNDALFCNYTDSSGNPIDTTTIGVDAGKFESADSFGKVIDGLRRVLRIVYIDSPLLDYPVGALDEPIYTLMDKEAYDRLYEVALNGVEEGVDLAPLQKYLYQKGIVDLPNVKGDRVMEEDDGYITLKFKVHKDTLEQFKRDNGNGKTEVIIDPRSYTDHGYNRIVARIRDILRDEYKKSHGNTAYPEALMTSIWEMMYEEKERAAFWQLYNLVKDEHADYNGKLYKNLEEYVIRKGLALYKPTGFNLENIKKENINTTIKAIAKMVADYIGFDVKDVVFTLFHDGDMLTSTGDSDRLDTIARHSTAWYEEVTRKQNTAVVETAKSSIPQQNTSRPTVFIKATNVGASVISSIAEAYNGNVEIRVEAEQLGKITIAQQ